MKQITLTQGRVALVDDADYDWLNKWRWCALRCRHTFYAVRAVCVSKGKKRQEIERMHRVILGLRSGNKLQCDHRDGNGLNNQRSNLRACTARQNVQSRRHLRIGTSMYKGVRWYPHDCKWYSHIRVNGKQIHLGSFDSEIDAARTYDIAALKHFGKFAVTNIMLGFLS